MTIKPARRRLRASLPAVALLALVPVIAVAQATTTSSTPDASQPSGQPAGQPSSSASSSSATSVVIHGQKATNKIDRQVYDNTKNIDSTTGTAADALNKVPSVNVDPNGNVTLRGNANVQIYVNGKPSAMMNSDNRAAALQAMSSGDIDSVEVMNNPGAQFSSDGTGGIINLVLKRNRRQGVSGAINANLGDDGRYNGAYSVSYSTGKLTLSGGLNIRHDPRTGHTNTDLQAFDTSGDLVSQTTSSGLSHTTIDNVSGNGGLDYTFSDKDSAGAQLNYSRRSFDISSLTSYDSIGLAPSTYTRNSTMRSPHEDDNLDVHWDHNGAQAGETLKTDLRLSRSDGHSATDEADSYVLPTQEVLDDTRVQSNNLKDGIASIDYNRPIGDDQLSVGAQITYDDNNFRNVGAGPDPAGQAQALNAQLTSLFTYQQTISAAYVTYQKPIGDKWTILGGVRAETLDLKTEELSATDEQGDQPGTSSHIQYTKLSPSFFATYAIDPARKLRLSYSHRLQRPGAQLLNPFQTYVDPNNVTVGNPSLKPQESDSFELGYEYTAGLTSYQLRGYSRKDDKVITQDSFFISPTVLETTSQNAGSGETTGLEYNFNGKATSKLMVGLNGNLFNTELTTLSPAGRQEATTLSGRLMLDYTATAADHVQFFYFTTGKQLTGQGYRSPFSLGNLAYSHKLNPKTSLVLTVSDPFRTMKFHTFTDTSTVHNNSAFSFGGPTIYMGLSYTFGGPSRNTPQSPWGPPPGGGSGGAGSRGPGVGGGM